MTFDCENLTTLSWIHLEKGRNGWKMTDDARKQGNECKTRNEITTYARHLSFEKARAHIKLDSRLTEHGDTFAVSWLQTFHTWSEKWIIKLMKLVEAYVTLRRRNSMWMTRQAIWDEYKAKEYTEHSSPNAYRTLVRFSVSGNPSWDSPHEPREHSEAGTFWSIALCLQK